MTQLERDNILLDLHKKMGSMEEEISGLKDNVGTLKSDVSGLKEETQSISHSVAVIEQVHGEKIQTILDIYPEFYKKFASFANNFVSNDHCFENLESRVYSLESKAANQ